MLQLLGSADLGRVDGGGVEGIEVEGSCWFRLIEQLTVEGVPAQVAG